MRIYFVKVRAREVIDKIMKKEDFAFDGLNWYESEIKQDDIVFIYFGGDSAQVSWQPGIRGIGKVSKEPYDKGYDIKNPNNFKIDIKVLHLLPRSIPPKETKIHPRYSEQLYEVPYVGAKHFATQAIARCEDRQAIKALSKIYMENATEIVPEIRELIGQTSSESIGTTCENVVSGEEYINKLWISLQAKQFLILTGLSGSGKTLLAQLFVNWICEKEPSIPYHLIKSVIYSEEFLKIYDVLTYNRQWLQLINKQGASGKIIPLPTQCIIEWYEALLEADKDAVDPKSFRHEVGKKSKFQKYIHGFYNELYKIAAGMIEHGITQRKSEEQRKQYEIIAVGADWTSSEFLLGYPDALNPGQYRKPDNGALDLILRAKDDPEFPYFLLLDEMNLSHVERYFADFLSAMESGETISLHEETDAGWNGVPANLVIPENLFVIGTVNVDETTYMFSPKVLDRANVIEFRVTDDEIRTFLDQPVKPDIGSIAGQGADFAKEFVRTAKQKNVELDEETRQLTAEVLMDFFPSLKVVGAEFGYRTAHEIFRLVYFHKEHAVGEWDFDMAMDAAIMQKLLPKLYGSKKKLSPVLDALKQKCESRFPISGEKITRMQSRLSEHGFTSFAEV